MSDTPEDRRRQIEALQQQIKALQSQTPATVGGDKVDGDKVDGDKVDGDKIVESHFTIADDARINNSVVVGVNLGRIIYGRDPLEDERRRLVWYLTGLAAKLSHLPLRGLEERLEQGDGMALPQVYVMLATLSMVALASRAHIDAFKVYFEEDKVPQNVTVDSLLALLGDGLKPAYDPNIVLPTEAITTITRSTHGFALERQLLATEAVYNHQHLILLGDPGSGKSTFVRHLAWALAQRGIDHAYPETALFGWDAPRQLMPIILSLRTLAGRLVKDSVHETIVYAALRDEIGRYNIGQVDDLLRESLHQGAVLLLFDGLDEVPLDGAAGVADRRTTLAAVRSFAQLHLQARIVVTCRTRAFDDGLRDLLGWPIETVAPFTLGQIRHFVPAWYSELVAKGQINAEQRERLSEVLIDTIVASPKLLMMAQTPLLLTMMALVLYNKGELPRDRPHLYERVLELLLGQWDQVRNGQSLADAIGLPDWGSDRIQPLLDRLSYNAHNAATSEDGRGRIGRGTIYLALIDFFTTARVPHPGDVALRCLEYIEQRSGLLMPDKSDSYMFAHLTLQEHCAGRHIALGSDDPAALIMGHRADDRWREPIMLGMGLVHPAVLNSVLEDLIHREEDAQPKPVERWYRDLILAAEIGQDRDWDYLRTRPLVKVDRLQQALRHGLLALLQDQDQLLPVAERVRADFLLGDLDDPRYPVTIAQWSAELARAQSGDLDGYFCRVEAGTYIIGNDDPDANPNEKPQHTVTFDAAFLIARYPITNEQWRAWVQAGGQRSSFDDHSGLKHSNQPVVGVDWRMCKAFCRWLSKQLGENVRLPSEYEWEAAARGGDARHYPWGNDWQHDRAATSEDREMRGWRWTVPVGCYPAGVATCGAHDLAGNVWEWTADRYRSYPFSEKPFTHDLIVLRGGGYNDERTNVRCGTRNHNYLVIHSNNGFRVVVVPWPAQPS